MCQSIAIVGMSCRYADASSPEELWKNVLAQRCAFRRIPSERLRLEDYFSDDRDAPDSIYAAQAAVIEGFEFDRLKYKIAGSTFRSADMAHWLALDTAAKAFADAGFSDKGDLPKDTTGVFLGNTLTGEFSRAGNLRLRYPFVRRMVESVFREEGKTDEGIEDFLTKLEKIYKNPFPPIGEESLAGNLSNTIAGRICNFFDLKGGGYTIDGACSSSLLAIAHACTSLAVGDVDMALAGGVDLSLDPFELVGFAKTGALASKKMRVYDAQSNGFFPGEGCGFVVLMREEDAIRGNKNIFAAVKGWGISSDGSGGITRPEVAGQTLALKRAYDRSGFAIETVSYFEGHGTGTAVGDTVELKTLSNLCRGVLNKAKPAVIGSIKTLIGHTKAAAGVASLIKAVLVLKNEILPPTAGCETPHPEISKENSPLRTLEEAEIWDASLPLRAGISSMGFGGINTHVVLERFRETSRPKLNRHEKILLASAQDAELFLLSSKTREDILQKLEHLTSFAARLSLAEMSDLSAQLARQLEETSYRAAIIATEPLELEKKIKLLIKKIQSGETQILDEENDVFYGNSDREPRIGFVFSGQGSPSNLEGGLWRKRFSTVRELYEKIDLKTNEDATHTRIAQPAIVTASVAGLCVLDEFNINARVGVGHSLGEITALYWAEAFDLETLWRIAVVRGQAMTEMCETEGSMLSVSADKEQVGQLLNGNGKIVIAALNAPRQTVVSGEKKAIESFQNRLQNLNIASVKLPVSHAFHSPLVEKSAKVLAEHLKTEAFQSIKKTIFSTVTGEKLSPKDDLGALLHRQITEPVRFVEAIKNAEKSGINLWIEAGTGKILCGLIKQFSHTPTVALEAGSQSLKGLFQAVGASFILGQKINAQALYNNRFTRPFNLDWQPKFFVNPCELAPLPSESSVRVATAEMSQVEKIEVKETFETIIAPIELIKKLVAERAELPVESVKDESRMLSDLHLNSITVGQIVTSAARFLDAPTPLSPTDFADASVEQIAEGLEKLRDAKNNGSEQFDALPAGLDVWVKPFRIELVERQLPNTEMPEDEGNWRIFASPEFSTLEKLRDKATLLAGSGTIVCLTGEENLSLLLEGAKEAIKNQKGKFIVIQKGVNLSAFARSFTLENPKIPTCVINLPAQFEIDIILAEISSAQGFTEVFYDENDKRFEPLARPLPFSSKENELALTAQDVLLVTGGAKGITAECILALAKKTNVRLALLGTSMPEKDAELAGNLARFRSAKIEFRYFTADVTHKEALRVVVEQAEAELGKITAILHAAAKNEPELIANLEEEKLRKMVAVKLGGARNLLDALPPEQLKLFITFGSIIARTGLPGESDYGVANQLLTRFTEEFQKQNPNCRCLAIEWSVWSEIGMGARIADLDLLERQGITPIPLEKGVEAFLQILSAKNLPPSFVVMSRFRDIPAFPIARPPLPLRRFLEEPVVYYPKTELIADVELSTGNDLYLEDHRLNGERIFPAVLGLEAMAQAASALLETDAKPVFRDVKFSRPVVVEENQPLKIRLLALARDDETVEVALRSSSSDFQIDHFRALCGFAESEKFAQTIFELNGHTDSIVEINPSQDIYGKILFHRGRFQRLTSYKHLEAKECLAEISANGKSDWFGQFLPSELLLGDPARRDAAIHAIQACIPQTTLLPVGVGEIFVSEDQTDENCLIHAKEISREGNLFTYDLEILNSGGDVREIWKSLRLQAISGSDFKGEWIAPLLAVYLERKACEFLEDETIRAALVRDSVSERRKRSRKAIQNALGEETEIFYRGDGKPEVIGGKFVSASHAGDLTLAVAGEKQIACDIEIVEERDEETWRDLLGDDGFRLARTVAAEAKEDFNISANRIWTAKECLKKMDASSSGNLTFLSTKQGGWVILASGNRELFSYITKFQKIKSELAFGILNSK
ncbi:MAG TPA: SDR family NAD(P)-dependent oxidoreductase [Pyrinomonadaceae bacterium]|nr:SDR family NAD(P)-dependent oxidoreductase [Pyrinomonadaceae bacterium]